MDGELGERVESTFEGRVLVLPHQSHDGEGFFHACAAFFEIRTVDVVFERPPTHANTKCDSTTRDLIDGRDLFGDAHRVVNWELEDPRSDSDGRCPCSNCGKERERIAQIPGHEVVMSDSDGVEARLFRNASEIKGFAERVRGREVLEERK